MRLASPTFRSRSSFGRTALDGGNTSSFHNTRLATQPQLGRLPLGDSIMFRNSQSLKIPVNGRGLGSILVSEKYTLGIPAQ